jgi:hypothetical protein
LKRQVVACWFHATICCITLIIIIIIMLPIKP